jgi:hypothetical protein
MASAAIGLGYYAAVAWADVRIYLLEVSGATFMIWVFLVGRRLFALARPQRGQA